MPKQPMENGSPRSVWMDDPMWHEIRRVAVQRSEIEGKNVSAAEIIRRGVLRELHQHYEPGWYRKPWSLAKIIRELVKTGKPLKVRR